MISSFSLHFPYSVRKEENGNTWTQALVEGGKQCPVSERPWINLESQEKSCRAAFALNFGLISIKCHKYI
ncbi:hypothetical protein E5288_WYG018117 [Bos mutus]|uniref:Uncharacterized protein n=1 Tax=Bos mutus TaxID=72004 RepID=A0A6B0RCV6_9CETA|nr:hypothetical protein [Bos mutus]